MTAVYAAVLYLWAGSEILIALTHLGPMRARGQDRWSGPVLVACVVLALWLGARLSGRTPGEAIDDGRAIVFGLGIALALAGIGLRWWAVLTLGRFFTPRVTTRPDQTVVQRGPYRVVRHPSYTGALMTVLGVLVCSTNWLSVACFVIALPGVAYRIAVEERALVGALGQPYRDYMRRTKRLVPFLV